MRLLRTARTAVGIRDAAVRVSLPHVVILAAALASVAAALWAVSSLGGTMKFAAIFLILLPQAATFAVVLVWARQLRRIEAARHQRTSMPLFSHASGADRLQQTDPLTGLGNKAAMHALLHELFAASPVPVFAAGILDIDAMKPVNELLGYAGGDELLRQCGSKLSAAVGNSGQVFRYGGDEFAFVLTKAVDPASVQDTGRLLQEALAKPFDFGGRTVRLSGSCGFAMSGEGGATIPELMHSIATALQHSKLQGRGRATMHTPELAATVRDKARLEQALRGAVAANAVVPYFQPIVSLQDGSLCGFEALARWSDAELGEIDPSTFIALAEETGLIGQLTRSLLSQAAHAAAQWPGGYFLSFNLSGVQLGDAAIAASVKEIIDAVHLPPHRLEIEVTEGAVMADPATASQILAELHGHGIRISMDDFGTGQSSLGRLRELVLDKVKIDRSFVQSIETDRISQHIVRAITEMCAGLNIIVVAEGVETLGQAATLQRFGCHKGQGFLFGKPRDGRDALAYIQDHLREHDMARFAVAV